MNFNQSEREMATALIDEILLVSRDAFYRGMRSLIDNILKEQSDSNYPVALYAERDVNRDNVRVYPLFQDSEIGRAMGPGVAPIIVNPDNQEVGSEGAIANLITDYCRLNFNLAIPHPGPDDMRSRKVKRIVIVTDFIGSGERIWKMLEAFRVVATIRSWRSYGLIDFWVVAYSGTEVGLKRVRTSRLQPTVRIVTGCPTIQGIFEAPIEVKVTELCNRYPVRKRYPLGFKNTGALIAFAHGMPNNAPPILHSSYRGWTPLFKGRSTTEAEAVISEHTTEMSIERIEKLLCIRNAREYLDDPRNRRWVKTMVVLSALESGTRKVEAISAQLWLPLSEVQQILINTKIACWTNEHNSLTPLGRQELTRLRRRRRQKPVITSGNSAVYYPTQLRAR